MIPAFVCPNAPLDVVEGYVWGHEWLLGTYKHPPMQAWWLETISLFTGQAPWTHLLASQIAIVISFWAVWQTARRIIVDRTAALISVLLLEGVVYYNYTSTEFNPNVLQLPFWALIGLYIHRAVKENRLFDWVLLGLWSACGLYSKYSTGLLLAALCLLMLLHSDSRRRLREKGPYIAVLVTITLFIPHVVWLFHNDFMPFVYVQSRLHTASSAKEYFIRPLKFLLNQILVMSPMILLLFALAGRKLFLTKQKQAQSAISFDRLYLNIIVFAPFLSLLLVSIAGTRLKDMWGTPLWGFLGIWVVDRYLTFSPQSIRRFAYSWAAVFVATLLIYTGTTILYPYITHKSLRVYFPGQALSDQIIGGWNQKYQTPLNYIIGDTWPAGNIAYYPPGRQHVLINGDYKISPWIKPTDIEQQGAVIVWCIENCACRNHTEQMPEYVRQYPKAEIQPPLILPRQTSANVPPVIIGWAILPPATP